MNLPLVGLCIWLCLGILAATCFKIPFLVFFLFSIISLSCAMLFKRKRKIFTICILCTSFFLGAALLKNSRILPADHIANFTPHKGRFIIVEGRVDSDPVSSTRGVSFMLKPEVVQTDKQRRDVRGKMLVRFFKKEEIRYGDKLVLEGKIFKPYRFSEEFDYRKYLERLGIYTIMSVKKDSRMEKLGNRPGNPIKFIAYKIKNRLREITDKNLSSLSAGVLNAIILGERQNLSSDIREDLVRTGSIHIMAVSGLHVGIVVFIALMVLKILRVPRTLRYFLVIGLVIVYCVLTGARIPVVRSTIMAVIVLFAYLLGRRANIFNSLSLAAFIILCCNPLQLFEVSFQLSFLSVIFIVWLTPKIKSIFHDGLNKNPVTRFFCIAFSVALSAWVGLMPLIAYYFGICSPVTVLANMIIVPYMTIVVASGFTLAFAGLCFPAIAPAFAASCELFISILVKINSLLVGIPGAYFYLPDIPFTFVTAYYIILIVIYKMCVKFKKQKLAI